MDLFFAGSFSVLWFIITNEMCLKLLVSSLSTILATNVLFCLIMPRVWFSREGAAS